MNCATHYKFFGTHSGILYGKQALLEQLFAYKVRPASNHLPYKFETGTQNHEGIAGVLDAIEYFEWHGAPPDTKICHQAGLSAALCLRFCVHSAR